MGRQLPLALTAADAVSLVDFINRCSPCRLYTSFAPDRDDLWLGEWGEHTFGDSFSIHIWPTEYSWQPIYAQTGGPRCPAQSRGLWYVANDSVAPVLELSGNSLVANATPIEEHRPQARPASIRYSRIYWAQHYSATDAVEYDIVGFSKLVDRIWRWIRKVGTRQRNDEDGPYLLPEAWRQIHS